MLASPLGQKGVPPFGADVVDNDEAESARMALDECPPGCRYLVEERPGVAAGRNRVVDAVEDDADVTLVKVQ